MKKTTAFLFIGLFLLSAFFYGCAGSGANTTSGSGEDSRYINKTDKINTERDRKEAVKEALDGLDD